MAKSDRRQRLVAALPVALLLLALPPSVARADADVTVGGYLDSALVIGLPPSAVIDPAPALTSGLGRLGVVESGRGASLTYFTPRLSGFQLGLGYTSEAFSFREPTNPIGHVPGQGEGDGALAVGGGLSLSALELGLAPYTQGARGSDIGLVTAGVGYGFGPLSTSLTYGFAKPAADEELNLLAFSAGLSVVPGVAVTGGVAYAEEEKSGDQTAAGMLGIRLNF